MTESEFLENTEKQDAVIRNLEIIEEAVYPSRTQFNKGHRAPLLSVDQGEARAM